MKESLRLELNKISSIDEIKEVYAHMKTLISAVQKSATLDFHVGDAVKFESSRRGIVTGYIDKINAKTIRVRTANAGTWVVSPTCLTKI